MEKIQILIVDDEILIAEDLKDILTAFGCKQIAMAHNKADAIEMLGKLKVDVALLDIRMEKELDGLELGEHINKHYHIPFIYITAHSDMSMIREIVKTKPVGYITKPFKKSDLFASINLATEQLNRNQKISLQVKDGYETVIIPFNEILYIESEGNYVNIFCQSRKLVSRQSLESIMDELDENIFFRIHRSYVINVSKTTKFSRKEVEMKGTVLPVSRNLSEEFETRMKKFFK